MGSGPEGSPGHPFNLEGAPGVGTGIGLGPMTV
jgi:hypothetical protein